MTAISNLWEAHRDELCKKIIELGEVHIEKLVMTLSKEQLIDQNVTDIVVEMSEQETVETILQSVGSKIASNPTAVSHFLDIIKKFGIQSLAETIKDKMSSLGSLMIPGMLRHMPKGKGTPALSDLPPIIGASSHNTGTPTHHDYLDIQSDHSNAAASSNTQSKDTEDGRIHTVPSIQPPQRILSLTLDTGNMCYPQSEQAPTHSNTSSPIDHLNQDTPPNPVDRMRPWGIRANDSGIVLDLPEVQRSLSGGTSESSSDGGLLEGASSPLKKKVQKWKRENRELMKMNLELEEENLELKKENLGLKHEVSELQKKCVYLQRTIYGLRMVYITTYQRCQELEKEIEVAKDPKRVSLHLGRESERVKEMEAEMNRLKNETNQYEKKIQELEQQKEEVVRMAVSPKYFLPGTCAEGDDDFDFAYYLARNNLENAGMKCKVCSQQVGKCQMYCQVCLPVQVSHEEHVKLKLKHNFQSLKTTRSHIYSEALLRVACRGNSKTILKASINTSPNFITPHACYWNLPECTQCDESTSDLESNFKQCYEAEYYHTSQPSLVDSDAVLFYIYIHRGLAVNVDLMHYLSCSNCNQYVLGIRNILHQAWNFRKTILSNYNNKDEKKKKEDMDKMAKEAKENLLFHTVGIGPDAKYLIEFPFLCAIQTEVGSCALVYAQIPPCCWAVPLDPSSPALPKLHSNFPTVVDKINKALFDKHEEYLKSIPVKEGKSPKLIIRYLRECCLKVSLVSLDAEVVANCN